ncbi:hypothetical protein [Cupriavidus sp. H19C3]|uniref:hypothetical protein n=1 Tax=Cupriavidus sp. H19C3 TaxID=3241603 RepID=UPI003BF8ECFE
MQHFARTAATILSLLTMHEGIAAPAVAGQINGAVQVPLPLYLQPGDSTPAQRVTPTDLPWQILAMKDDFYRVRVAGREYWVDSMTVRVARGSKATCDTTVLPGTANHRPTGSTAGAGEEACR